MASCWTSPEVAAPSARISRTKDVAYRQLFSGALPVLIARTTLIKPILPTFKAQNEQFKIATNFFANILKDVMIKENVYTRYSNHIEDDSVLLCHVKTQYI